MVNWLGYSVHRSICSSFGSISIRSRLKVSFEDRFQNELERSLDHDHGSKDRCSIVRLCHLVDFVKCFYLADMNVQSSEAPSWFSLRLDV
jgi:hypothetical protein